MKPGIGGRPTFPRRPGRSARRCWERFRIHRIAGVQLANVTGRPMPIYISMLRGINVGGHKRIRMDQLRASFEALGFEQVKTYIQSGNVVFKAGKLSPAALSRRIEERFLSDFVFSAAVISRTANEIATTIKNNPFLNQSGI